MALSFMIEYLLAQERPGGGRLVMGGGVQTIVPVFPPATTLTLTYPPPGPIYMQIYDRTYIGRAVVPSAFEIWWQQAGNKSYNALASGQIDERLDHFTPCTHAEPLIVSISNLSNLNQYWESYSSFIEIPTEEDYKMVMGYINRVGTSVRLEEQQAEATRLLSILAGAR